MCAAHRNGIWFVDFEFHPAGGVEGNALHPVCLVALELHSGTSIRMWQNELLARLHAPFPTDADALFVAYNASAEMACFQVLGWPAPINILDLYAEFRNHTNGRLLPAGRGLIGALTYFGEPSIDAITKDAMRDLVLSCGPWSAAQRKQILDYCESDVLALKRLFVRMVGGGRG